MGRNKTIQDEKLLQFAREVFLAHGAFGSTKEIARRAGVSEATLFKRYPTKAALFLAAMVPQEVDIDIIIHSSTAETHPRLVLTEICHRILGFFRAVIPVVMHLMTHPSISIADVTGHFKSMPEQALADALAEHFKKANSRGLVKVDNPIATAGLLVAAIHSLAVFELMEFHGGQNMDHAVAPFVDALWSGMAPTSTTRKIAPPKKGMRKR